MAAGRTRRKPRYGGSIRNCEVSDLERKEYEQTGMIRVKETPAEGYYFHQWEWGYHRCINFSDIIGGHEVFRINIENFEPPASARLMDTWYGYIAVDNFPSYYVIMCQSYDQKRKLMHEFDLYGYRTVSHGSKTLVVHKPRKEFVAYQREDR